MTHFGFRSMSQTEIYKFTPDQRSPTAVLLSHDFDAIPVPHLQSICFSSNFLRYPEAPASIRSFHL